MAIESNSNRAQSCSKAGTDKSIHAKPSFASVAATGKKSLPTSAAVAIPASVSSSTVASQDSKESPPPAGPPHSITTSHVDKKTGEAYKITKYRDNTSVAGGFTKLGCAGGASSSEPKRQNSSRAPLNNNGYQSQHYQQRTPSPPSSAPTPSSANKPSSLAARRAASHQLNTTNSNNSIEAPGSRKPLAPLAINSFSGLLRSEFSPASFAAATAALQSSNGQPNSGGLSPSPTGLAAGRRSPYGGVPAPIPSPTHVSPHIANAYYAQSAKRGSATYNEDGELEYEDGEKEDEEDNGADKFAAAAGPQPKAVFGPPSPMLLPNLVNSDPNVETLLAYQAMLAQPAAGSAAANNTASLASAYLKYLEAQANLSHFVSSTLEQSVSASTAAHSIPASSSGALLSPGSIGIFPPHLSPEVLAALAQQERVAAQTLKQQQRLGASAHAAAHLRSPVQERQAASSTMMSPVSPFANIHQTPASSFRLKPTTTPSPFSSASSAATPISPNAWSNNRYTTMPSTPFSPFDAHPGRYLLSSSSSYMATPSAISATSSSYSSPLPSPASSTCSLPEPELMSRTESMQSTDSYTTYASTGSSAFGFGNSFRGHGDADQQRYYGGKAFKMGEGAAKSVWASTGGGGGVGGGSEADWSSNWRRRGPLDYPDASPLSTRQQHQTQTQRSELNSLNLELELQKLSLGNALEMPGAPLAKSRPLPSVFGGAGGGTTAAAVIPPTPTLLDQEFVDGLLRTGYSEDEGSSAAMLGQQRGINKAAAAAVVGGGLRASPSLLGLSGFHCKINPMVSGDNETPLARDVARF